MPNVRINSAYVSFMGEESTHSFELRPVTSQQSFYGKAQVYQYNGIYVLLSYSTFVCLYNDNTGELVRLWNGWSATTGKHISAFSCMFPCIPHMNKHEWDKLPTVETYTY